MLLTRREQEILLAAGEGLTNKQIAYSLRLSSYTVRNRLAGIYEKLEVHNRIEALRKYYGFGTEEDYGHS